jgi:hypothetical protein
VILSAKRAIFDHFARTDERRFLAITLRERRGLANLSS